MKMVNLFRVGAMTAALLCGLGGTASATDDPALPTVPDLTRSRELFEEGKRLMHAGDFERALERFRASRTLHAGKGNTQNVAHCLGELDRVDEALDVYEDLLARFGADLTAEERTSVASYMTLYRRKVGTLDVSADADGMLMVDGRPRGRLPLTGALRLLPGSHFVRIVKGGYATHEETVTVLVGRTTTLDATLTPLLSVGGLRVDVDPHSELTTHGTLSIDGSPVGELPWEGNLAPGPHVLFASSGDTGSDLVSVIVLASRLASKTLSAHRLSPALHVRVEPPTARVSIDGVAVGRGGFEGRLPVGDHEVVVAEDGYTSERFTIHSSPDSAGDRRVTLIVDAKHPRWRRGGLFRLEVIAAPLLAASLKSGAETYAGGGPAYGGLVAARFGYELPVRLAADLSVGWLSLNRDVTRSIKDSPTIHGQLVPVRYEVQDALRLTGPFLGLGIRQRIPFLRDRFDLRFGLGLDIGVLSARDFSTTTATSASGSASTTTDANGASTTTVMLFLTPDFDVRYRLGPVELGVGLGVAAFLTEGLPAATGETRVNVRVSACPPAKPADVRCVPGSFLFNDEPGFGRLVAWTPRLSLAWSF